MDLSLSWAKKKHRKYGKASGNCPMCHPKAEHSNIEEILATITAYKYKIESKKEGIKRNVLNSHTIEEKYSNKRLKGSNK